MDNRPPPPVMTVTTEDQIAKDVASIKNAVWLIAGILIVSIIGSVMLVAAAGL